MRKEIIDRAANDRVRLIISVDTGIRANEVVRYANTLGIDVIVTDHHLPETEIPPAVAVLNPNQSDCPYPDKSLCGAGVTLKLVQALLQRSGMPVARQTMLLDSMLKPVAIATVADVVPLVGENRIIVRRGLMGLRSVRNPGLRALLAVSGFDEGETPSTHQVAFRLAPRINAAGRMNTARDVVELFLTADGNRAKELAGQLDLLNRERQDIEMQIIEAILKQCEEEASQIDGAALVFCGHDWHPGVLGIVASRLVERFCRPVFVLTAASAAGEGKDEHHFSGSGRSIPAFHLLEALECMPDMFVKFGGHRQAAGLTLKADRVHDFRRRFREIAGERLRPEDLCPEYTIDAEAGLSEIDDKSVQQVLMLGPFGLGNPAPIFLAREVDIAGPPRPIGQTSSYNVPLRHGGRVLVCKAWGIGDRVEVLQPGQKFDVLFQIEDDPGGRKRGYGSWCVRLKDFRESAPRA